MTNRESTENSNIGKKYNFVKLYETKKKKIYKNLVINKPDLTLPAMLFMVFIGYIFIHDLLGGTLFSYCWWDSYSLQAERWLSGHIALEHNKEYLNYLEIAEYKGNYYVSFPPFPAVLLIPWVMIFGRFIPNNLIMIIYILIALTLTYIIAKKFNFKSEMAAFWSVFVVLGCNMLWMSTMGGVWFQAQLVNMILSLLTILCVMCNKRVLAYLFLALAVGCRPFSVLYFPVLFIWFYANDKKNNKSKSFVNLALMQAKDWIFPAIIAFIYFIYNYIRFDSLFEFGHNYLEEFKKDKQFSLSYLLPNLNNLFIRGISFVKGGRLEFSLFNGFWMYIVNPIFIVLLLYIIRNYLKSEHSAVRITLLIAMVLNIICLCLHRTLGGWQFGARYTVDLIPFAFLYILLSKNKSGICSYFSSRGKRNGSKVSGETKTHKWEIYLGIFAIMINVYGVMYMHIYAN